MCSPLARATSASAHAIGSQSRVPVVLGITPTVGFCWRQPQAINVQAAVTIQANVLNRFMVSLH